jgi:hypothetical protein
VSKTRQTLKKELFGEGWELWAVVEQPGANVGGMVIRPRTFACLRSVQFGDIYIEEYDSTKVAFQRIADTSLWNDLLLFLYDNGVLHAQPQLSLFGALSSAGLDGKDITWEASEDYVGTGKKTS